MRHRLRQFLTCSALLVALLLAAAPSQAQTVNWRGLSWTNVYPSNTIATDGATLSVTTGDASVSHFGGAFHPTSATIQASGDAWVETTVFDTGASPGVQVDVLFFDTPTSVFLATLGAFGDQPRYQATWRRERPSGTVITNSVSYLAERRPGPHTLGIARRADGRLEFWMDGRLVETSPAGALPAGFNYVYLVAAGTTEGELATFMGYREGIGRFPGSVARLVSMSDLPAWTAASSATSAITFEGVAPPSWWVPYDTATGVEQNGVRFTGRVPAPADSTTPTPTRHYLRIVDSAFHPPYYDWASGAVLHGPPGTPGPLGEGGPYSHIRAQLPPDVTAVSADLMSFLPYASAFKVVVSTARGSQEFAVQSANYPNRRFFGVVADSAILSVDFYAEGFPVVDNVAFGIGTLPPDCKYSLSPTALTRSSLGGEGSFAVTTGPDCRWSASASASWITLLPGSTCRLVGDVQVCPRGTSKVSFMVGANTGGERSAVITVAGQQFIVTQGGFACTFVVSPTRISVDSIGESRRLAVTAPAGCSWTATSPVPWATITSGASGTGNGSLRVDVAPNSTGRRTTTLTVAGQSIAVTQDAGACGAVDVSSQVSATRDGLTLIYPSSYQYSSAFHVRNTSGRAIPGPVYLVTVGLPTSRGYPNDVFLLGTFPVTKCFSSTGDYRVLISATGLAPGQRVDVPVIFATQKLTGFIANDKRVISGTPSK